MSIIHLFHRCRRVAAQGRRLSHMVQWVHALALTFPAASTRQRLHALTDQLRSQGEWPPHELRLMLRAWGAPAEHPVAFFSPPFLRYQDDDKIGSKFGY